MYDLDLSKNDPLSYKVQPEIKYDLPLWTIGPSRDGQTV